MSKKYRVASEPQPHRSEDVLYKITQDISHVSDVQGILAFVFSATLAAAIIYALIKTTSMGICPSGCSLPGGTISDSTNSSS